MQATSVSTRTKKPMKDHKIEQKAEATYYL